ncbi:DUF4157 domain-containing protein [Streptomyces glaucescens]|uniref:eCIS core domain-containing protein n=1 Tax=Streptomyces glaucescens TaxID=1907 RepID=UPI003BB7710E
MGARAYTSGSHVVLGEGGRDKETLAHELTHVIQQRQGPVSGTDNGSGLRVSDPSDRFEREAEANARRVMSAPRPATHAGADGAVQWASARQATTRTASVQRMPKAPKAKTGGKKKGSTPNAKDELIKIRPRIRPRVRRRHRRRRGHRRRHSGALFPGAEQAADRRRATGHRQRRRSRLPVDGKSPAPRCCPLGTEPHQGVRRDAPARWRYRGDRSIRGRPARRVRVGGHRHPVDRRLTNGR